MSHPGCNVVHSLAAKELARIHLCSLHISPKVSIAPASDFEFFILLAKLRSMSGAARALDLSPPAATKRLGIIEQRLGARLVNRTTRSVSLTPEGETYLRYASQIVGQVREMEEAISGARRDPHGPLRINATLGFGRTTIAPLVSDFARRFPNVEVQFEVTDRPVDLVEGAFDMAIRFGELPDSRLSARRIMSNRRFLCASPKYLERFGAPERVEDLHQHRCIIHRQNDDAYGVWRYIVNDHIEAIKVKGVLSSNDGDIALRWALDGHGILIRSEWDLAKYVQSGRLKLVLPNTVLPSADLFVYYPRQRNQTARARAFIDFLVDHFQAPFTPVDTTVEAPERKKRGSRK
ncbi:LysR family transcriptional activator of dmlA [Paraburkholderia youngii]